ncbi:DUF885 domain-containing protein [Polymorphobacter fuscus]|uniref:DUF885 family protein n=1 Tax=Sandarakinorhabdus fusca TaxID=1439888 RepID=A0A7C9KHB8_9SPHN|nr:DUF885 domain-containing protein [Polymorphobacter fuscus]KAB7648698.1 DUF885 domain-containing protein [Polymorphobacter fuscus]MQT16259.1 DUF885 family protein [Polymorphobacter fuscus]NJC07456.1 uncharacterized protein (DUF885 family) [Polymorphobacter fuscus]
MRHRVLVGSAALILSIAATPLAFAATAPVAATASEDARLTAFLDAEFAQEVKQRPQLATRLGVKDGQDKLDDISDAAAMKQLQWRRDSVARMKKAFDRARLSPAAQANFDIWALELDRAELSYRNRGFQPPFYSFLYSVHSQLPNFLISTHTVNDAADMKAYVARLRAIPGVLDTAIARSRQSDAAGIHAPRFQIERVIAGSRSIVTGAPFGDGPDSPLWSDIKAKGAKLVSTGKATQAEVDAMLAEARTALLAIRPAYDRVIAWAEADLPAAPSGRVGAVSLPGGADWYAAALKLATTTNLTPEQVHQTGLKEVARIEAEQDALARQAGFKDREAFYAERARLFPTAPWTDASRAEYLRIANESIANTRKLLPKYFGELPAYRMEVIREPSFSEVAGGAAHAAGPSPDGVRPGRVYVHLLGTSEDPAAVYDLMCHEGIPGHVMQGDIQARQSSGPKFRKAYGYVAFGEGWGLYSEALCKEMGAYPDLAADFMRLDAELFRAARLVVDTGIHAKGWTEQQANDYMIKTGRTPVDKARSEVRRYITLPGQATGYKIGMIKIMELRRKAEAALGSKFDLKSFHDLLIGSGSLPLDVLERRVDDWIAVNK